MSALSSTSLRTIRYAACAAILAGVSILVACGKDDGKAAECDSAKCAAGNTCLPLNGETKCRKTCESNSDPATSCPFGYTCTALEGDIPPFCVQSTARRDDGAPIEKRESGQWGAACQANLKMANPGCDGEQGFLCYGESPTDGNAYCTRYDCEQDSDCGAGFWCGKINKTPNVETAKKKSIGDVQNVCLRRTYCSPCKVDLDCPTIAGKVQHCVADESGQTSCSPECTGTSQCPNEARCTNFGEGWKACAPRAGSCVGDGTLCAPCRVDSDCGEDGACVRGQYTTEKTCAKKSTEPCGGQKDYTNGSCPKELVPEAGPPVRCYGFFMDQVPVDYCHGTYAVGKDGVDLGCRTPNR